VVRFHPVPPDARRRKKRRVADEIIPQPAPTYSRLDRRHPRVSEPDLIARFGFRAVATQTCESLPSDLDRRRQAVPLGVDARTRLLFRVAAQRKTATTERAVEKIEVNTVERPRQRRI